MTGHLLACEDNSVLFNVGSEFNIGSSFHENELVIEHVSLAVRTVDVWNLDIVDQLHDCVKVCIFALLNDINSHG